MAFKYNEVVPWGRNFDEYTRMFDLNETELKSKILGCGDGPSSFNFECNKRGGDVVSIDPIYNLTKEEIQKRINETYKIVLRQTDKNKDKFKVVYKKRMLFCIFSCTNSVRQFILSAWLLKLLIVGTVEVKISLNLARRPTINSATAAMIVVNKAAKTPQ